VEDLQWLVLVERQVGSVEAVKLRYPPTSCFVSRENFEAVIPSRARNLIGCHEGL